MSRSKAKDELRYNMNMNTKISAKDFFLQIGAIAAFYASIIALIMLLFRVINVAFPATRSAVYYGSSSISFQVATLIVAFPIFLLLSWLIQKSYVAEPALREAGLRRWLAYITLFVAGIVVASDLIIVIYMYLDGQELTTGFLLKVLTLLVLAGGVFTYYLREIRNVIKPKERNVWRAVSAAIVLVSIVLGFAVVGSPATQRALRHDQERLSGLQSIQWQVVNYWQQKGEVPASLEELRDPLSGFNAPVDPETNEPYVYAKTSELSFELCADFNRESPGVGNPSIARDMMYYGPGMEKNENWNHSAGEHCFDRTIDPELYPVRTR